MWGTLRTPSLCTATYYCSQNPDRTCYEETCQDVYTCGFLSCGACGTCKCGGEITQAYRDTICI